MYQVTISGIHTRVHPATNPVALVKLGEKQVQTRPCFDGGSDARFGDLLTLRVLEPELATPLELHVFESAARGGRPASLGVGGASAWPRERRLPGFRAAVEAHDASMLRVAARLRRLLGLALCGEAALFEAPALFANGTHQTGLVYYHAEPSEPLRGRLGIRPHADGGMFTLLWTDGSAGLHICPDKVALPEAVTGEEVVSLSLVAAGLSP